MSSFEAPLSLHLPHGFCHTLQSVVTIGSYNTIVLRLPVCL